MTMLFGLDLVTANDRAGDRRAAGPAEDEADETRLIPEYVPSLATLDAHLIAAHFSEPFVFLWANGASAPATHDDLGVAQAGLRAT